MLELVFADFTFSRSGVADNEIGSSGVQIQNL